MAFLAAPGMTLPPIAMQNDKGERFEIAVEELPSRFNRQIRSWDLSFEGEARSDYVAELYIATAGAKRFTLDSVHERLDFTQTIATIQDFRMRHPETASTSRTGPTVRRRLTRSLSRFHLQGKSVEDRSTIAPLPALTN